MLHDFSYFGSPAVAFVKGKLSGVSKDIRSRGHPPFCACLNCGPSTRSACFKVCYFWCCSLFAEIDPAFQLNTGILGLMF